MVVTYGVRSDAAELPGFLEETAYLNFSHPDVQTALAGLVADSDRATAVNIHNFDRDQVRFGWRGDLYAMSASEVLRAGVGYCNTKSTLFVALLRGAGIPARQHFVRINAEMLRPFVNLPQAWWIIALARF